VLLLGIFQVWISNYFQVKTNLADGINKLGGELDEIKEYKPLNNSSQPNGQGDI
jgi:hypothetical protein